MEIRTGTIVKALKNDPMFSAIKFVISARDREKGSMFPIRFIHSDGKRLTGCDGHRMHYANDVGIPAGLYEVARNMPTLISLEETTTNIEYPDSQHIIDLEPKKGKDDPLFAGDIEVDYAIMAKMLPDGIGVNYNFFKDAHSISPFMICTSDPNGLIVFRAENLTAIIMPFSIK